jgi:hypothetical protein
VEDGRIKEQKEEKGRGSKREVKGQVKKVKKRSVILAN